MRPFVLWLCHLARAPRSPAVGAILASGALGLGACDDLPAPASDSPAAAFAGLVGEVDDDTRGIVAIIQFDQAGNEKPYGTGTLIAPNIVLTAHHVVASAVAYPDETDLCSAKFEATLAPEQLGVMTTTAIFPEPAIQHAVRAVYTIPGERGEPELCGRDIALVVLAEPLTDVPVFPLDFARVVTGATLADGDDPSDRDFEVVAPGTPYTQYGYGRVAQFENDGKGTRRKGDRAALCAMGDTACYERLVSKEWIGEGGTCPGDSGGPAIADGKVIGVTSRGSFDCGVVFFIGISPWEDWFRERLTAIAAETGVAIPWLDTPGGITPVGPANADGCGGSGRGTSAWLGLSGVIAAYRLWRLSRRL